MDEITGTGSASHFPYQTNSAAFYHTTGNSNVDIMTTGTRVSDACKVKISEAGYLRGKNVSGPVNAITKQDAQHLFSAFYHSSKAEAAGLVSLALSLKGRQLSSFLTVASNAGDDLGALIQVVAGLSSEKPQNSIYGGTVNSADTERGNFLEAALHAGDSLGNLIRMTEKLSGDTRKAFLAFAAELSEDDLKNFIAADASESEMADMLRLSRELSETDRKLFWQATAIAGEDLAGLIQVTDNLLNAGRGQGSNLTNFLTAAKSAEERIGKLIDITMVLPEDPLSEILSFTAGLNPSEVNDFLAAAEVNAGSRNRNLMDVAESLSGNNRRLFLLTAKDAGSSLDGFVRQTALFSGKSGAASDADLSGYLKTAANAGPELGKFIGLAGKAGGDKRSAMLSLTAGLTVTDLRNFVCAAVNAGKNMDELIMTTGRLSGSDRSCFLHAAASTGSDLAHLIERTNELEGDELGAFLLDAANAADKSVSSRHIYMKKLLTGREFDNFVSAAGDSDENLDELIRQTEALEGSERSSFLEAAAAAEEKTGGFLNMISRLSENRRSGFLSLSAELKGDNLKNFVTTAIDAHSNFEDFVTQTSGLRGDERNKFLSAAAAAEKDLGSLIELVGSLKGMDRLAFLSAASDAGPHLGDLIRMADHLIDSQRSAFLAAAAETGFDMEKLFFSTSNTVYSLRPNASGKMALFRTAAEETGFDFNRLFTLSEGRNSYEFNKVNSNYVSAFVEAAREAGFELDDYIHDKKTSELHLIGTDPEFDFSKVFISASVSGKLLGTFIESFF